MKGERLKNPDPAGACCWYGRGADCGADCGVMLRCIGCAVLGAVLVAGGAE